MGTRTKVRAADHFCRTTLPPGSRIGLAVAAALASVAAPRTPAFAATADASSGGLQEVVVTARKREENLQDVPISIDVFTQKDLQNLAITQFDDYAAKVPSISFISVGPGTQVFFMRGVSDGSNPNYANSSATGFFLDDMSLSCSECNRTCTFTTSSASECSTARRVRPSAQVPWPAPCATSPTSPTCTTSAPAPISTAARSKVARKCRPTRGLSICP